MNHQLNVLLIDDEQTCLNALKASLDFFNYVNVLGEVQSGMEAVKFLQEDEVDLIFLKIEMGGMSGFELAKHIQSIYPDVMIIFFTGNAEFALEGYEYQPIDFLMKPINVLRLEKALSRARNLKNNHEVKKDIQIGIRVEGGFEIINVSDVLYIEKVARKIYIVCKDGERLNSSASLQKLEVILREYNFFRVHQSFLVPIDKIKSIHIGEFKRSYTLELKNVKEILPLSRDKYNELKKLLVQKDMIFC